MVSICRYIYSTTTTPRVSVHKACLRLSSTCVAPPLPYSRPGPRHEPSHARGGEQRPASGEAGGHRGCH